MMPENASASSVDPTLLIVVLIALARMVMRKERAKSV
jgi:hypothetical protein